MDEDSGLTAYEKGRISRVDRLQRLVIGGALMLLTLSGSVERFDWRVMVALTLQAELLLTGLVGWCPIYWTCRLRTTDE